VMNVARGSPRIYVDMTTAFEEAGRLPHGTTRVERGIVAGIAEIGAPNVEFCRFHRRRGRFVIVPQKEAASIATAASLPEARRNAAPRWRGNPTLRAGRRIEAWVRRNLRDRLRRQSVPFMNRLDSPHHAFAPGSTLLFPGEMQRHDFRLLMELRRRRDLRLAFVYFDMLNVLSDDDPRVKDPSAVDIPSTDFMVREGSLLLSISRYSAKLLLEHVARQGRRCPPIEVIRLGHSLTQGKASAMPVAELETGRFVLAVGDVVPRKNYQRLAAIWKRMAESRTSSPPPLVIVGRVGAEGAEFARGITADDTLRRTVRILPNTTDDELRWLYGNCRLTVFPSLDEGYGLPVSESLAFGKVCVASSAAAIPEASQGLGIHLDPRDDEAWLATLSRLFDDDAEIRARENDIQERYRPVHWRDTGMDVLGAIGRLYRRR
jgi:glycosyltransferase involved in cell wall biosynthesis